MLYEYCAKKDVRHERPGKLLVATDEQQVSRLRQYLKVGKINGVELKVRIQFYQQASQEEDMLITFGSLNGKPRVPWYDLNVAVKTKLSCSGWLSKR